MPKTKRRALEALRRKIRRIEIPGEAGVACLSLGIPEIDGALPGGGLRAGCVHEIGGDEAATGFCAVLLARAGRAPGPLMWLARGDDLYLPGLVRYGIEPGRLLVASGLRRRADMLWAMEEALRCRALRGVVAEVDALDRAASRRLMLAAEGSGVPGLVLWPRAKRERRGRVRVPTADSRWRVTTVPGAGMARWRVEVLHCRGGRPGCWVVEMASSGRPHCPARAPRKMAATRLPRRLARAARGTAARDLSRRVG
ncbi:MAG: hypothetical protein F4X13_09090 [Gammaproteobacteria bacterium]|nr:hypothetical protein [Gammaproteobacteria bacterium]